MRAASACSDPAVPDDGHCLAHLCRGGATPLHRRHIEPPQRRDQTESGRLVIRQCVSGKTAAVVGRDPDRFGFRDEIADGENEPVRADDHAVTDPLGAQDRCA